MKKALPDTYQKQMERYPSPRVKPLLVITADRTLDKRETGSKITNSGATGTVTVTLPDSHYDGLYFEFVLSAAQELRIDPGSEAIVINGAAQTAGKYVGADDENEYVCLTWSDTEGKWIAGPTIGTWTVEA